MQMTVDKGSEGIKNYTFCGNSLSSSSYKVRNHAIFCKSK